MGPTDVNGPADEQADVERARRLRALRAMARQQLGLPQPDPEADVVAGDKSPRAGRPGAGRPRAQRTLAALALVTLVLGGMVAAHSLTPTRTSEQRAGGSAGPHVGCASAGPPYALIKVSNDTFPAHSEPMVAQNPRNPLNLVGGSKFFTDPSHYRFQIGTYTSFDGGCTWRDGGVLPGFAPGATTSDVSIAFGLHNDVYVAVLYANHTGSGTFGYGESGVAVSTSHDGGQTFGPPVYAYDDTTGAVFSDKPWIVVDQSRGARSGSIYVVWSYDHGGACADNGCEQDVGFARSTDGGKSFSSVRQVESSAPFCTNPATGRALDSRRCDAALGTIPVVEPDGTLAVAFAYEDLMNTGKIPTRLLVIASHDGGDSWTSPALVATITDVYGTFPPQHYRNVSLPAFACDPGTGQLYLAWADKGSGGADILLSTSRDGGRSWTAPVQVNDDASVNFAANHFQPQLAVAPDGVVSVMFFDTRNDPQRGWIDVYVAQSVDHGATFLANIRVTAQSWDPATGAPVDSSGLQFIGDYQGLAVDNAYVYPFWNDSRTGTQQIFTAVVPSAARR